MPTAAQSAENRQEAIRLLIFNVGVVYRVLRMDAGRSGIRWTASMALKHLQAMGPLSQKQLADLEQLRPATMSVLVRELLAERLITREPDELDRRAVKIRITPEGEDRLKREGARFVQSLERLFEPMDDAELADLVKGEQQLERALRHRLHRAYSKTRCQSRMKGMSCPAEPVENKSRDSHR